MPAALATLLWLPQARQTVRAVVPARARGVAVYRYALAWQVTAFMGLQSLLYFATLSWLPTILRDRGATPETAGNLLSLMVLGNFAASLVPVVAQRLNGQRVLAVSAAAGLAAGLAGALYAPLGSAAAWVLILGVSQGAALALAILFTIARAPDPVAQVQSSGVYRGDPGATLADAVNVRAYLTDMSQLPEYGKVRAARFTGTPPTVTTVEVSRLFVPGALLEVEVLAIA